MKHILTDIEKTPAPLIGAYRPPFKHLMNSRADAFEAYAKFAEAGLSLAVGEDGDDDERTRWVFEACEKLGVKQLVNIPPQFYGPDPGSARPAVDRLLASPAFYAFIMRDEPGASLFPELARAREASEAMMPPDKFSMANLFPNQASPAQMEIPPEFETASADPGDPYERHVRNGSYREYIRRYLDTVKPRVLCHDHYPISNKSRADEARERINDYSFLKNLAVARAESGAHGIPYWSIIQAWGYNDKPAPDLSETRWQINANNVLGAGLTIYFVYQNSYPEGTGPEKWVNAPVDFYGAVTPQYDILRQANREYLVFARALSGFRHEGVMLHAAPEHLPFAVTSELLLEKYEPVRAVDGADALMIGCMSKGPLRGLYVMNASRRKAAEAVLNFNGTPHIEMWGKDGREMNDTATSAALSLEKGEAKFIVFSQ